MEIEKKFLVDEENIPDLSNVDFCKIEQGYLNIKPDPIIRIRKKDNEYYLTYKRKIKKGVAEEYELPITEEIYNKLKKSVESNIVRKTRYYIKTRNNFVIELDVYKDNLCGLVTAEVEFENEEQYNGYVAEKWFKKDITGDVKYINSRLSLLSNIDELNEDYERWFYEFV